MRQRWEYLLVLWERYVEQDGEAWEYPNKYRIYRPGTKEPEITSMQTQWNEMLTEFGADGWELVSEVVQHSTEVPYMGWPAASYPIVFRWTFKRPAEDQE